MRTLSLLSRMKEEEASVQELATVTLVTAAMKIWRRL